MPPRSQEGYRRWAGEQAVARPEGDLFQLAIESVDGGTLVGAISTIETRPVDGFFGYGVAIGREHQRRGYGRDAVLLLLRFMFAERRYTKCTVGVYAGNAPSLAMHRSWGSSRRAASGASASPPASTKTWCTSASPPRSSPPATRESPVRPARSSGPRRPGLEARRLVRSGPSARRRVR